jgi:hypothetical protein
MDKAEAIAAQIAARWHADGAMEESALVAALTEQLVAESNMELRQVLTQLRASLDMALDTASHGTVTLPVERVARMLGAVDRATDVVDVCLDRNVAHKLLIRLEPEVFSLGSAMGEFLRQQGLERSPHVRFGAAPARIEGDRPKLVAALGYTVNRFVHNAGADDTVFVAIHEKGDSAEGFIGSAPSRVRESVLVEELQNSMSVDEAQLDTPFVRAILERHGGTLYVAKSLPDAIGFGFTLPLFRGAA